MSVRWILVGVLFMAICIKVGPYAVHWVLFYDSREPLSSWEVSREKRPWEEKVWPCFEPSIAHSKSFTFTITSMSTAAVSGQPCMSHKHGVPQLELPDDEDAWYVQHMDR